MTCEVDGVGVSGRHTRRMGVGEKVEMRRTKM